jgi:hypothetical protein
MTPTKQNAQFDERIRKLLILFNDEYMFGDGGFYLRERS